MQSLRLSFMLLATIYLSIYCSTTSAASSLSTSLSNERTLVGLPVTNGHSNRTKSPGSTQSGHAVPQATSESRKFQPGFAIIASSPTGLASSSSSTTTTASIQRSMITSVAGVVASAGYHAQAGARSSTWTQPRPSSDVLPIFPPTVPSLPLHTPSSGRSSSQSPAEEVSGPTKAAFVQSSVTQAFEDPHQSQTSFLVGSTLLQYKKETIASLSTITADVTITTAIVATNKDSSPTTLPAAAIVVGPGGTWWNGGVDGFNVHGPPCIWPFCPPGGANRGGGGGGGGGSSESNQNTDNQHNSNKEDGGSQGEDGKDTNNEEDDNQENNEDDDDDKAESTSTILNQQSSTRSTSSSSRSSTSTARPCSPDYTECKVDSSESLKLPRRGLRHYIMERRTKELGKRYLKTPYDYQGNAAEFMRTEYDLADKLNIFDDHGGHSTGFSRPLLNKRYDAAVGGLTGCTSVIVASQAGVWVSHFWEVPSFRSSKATWTGRTRTGPDRAIFLADVLNQLTAGGPGLPGLAALTEPGRMFHESQGVVWTIVTPRGFSEQVGTYRYDEELLEIQQALRTLFSKAGPPVIVDYLPIDDQRVRDSVAGGRILFQHEPMFTMMPGSGQANANGHCSYYQQAMFQIWVEDGRQPRSQAYWPASGTQLIDSTYNPFHRRDAALACPIASKLPEASTARKGADVGSHTVAEAGQTHWITFDAPNFTPTPAKTGTKKTEDMFSSMTSSLRTVATTAASMRCIADGAAWFSPTRWCDCGPSATYATLPTSAQDSNDECAYTAFPATQITPISTGTKPTNIPGVGGLPGCAPVMYPNGQQCPYTDYCNCGGTPVPYLTSTISGTVTSDCNYSIQPTASDCPAPTTTPPPELTITAPPSLSPGTISCGKDSPDITSEQVNAMIGMVCNSHIVQPANTIVDAAVPSSGFENIPTDFFHITVNHVYVVLVTTRSDCASATFGLGASASACSSYMAAVTNSCTQGGGVINSAGCFDWGVKAYTVGDQNTIWPTPS
ncbi:MAG: hypothetical protein Q9168_002387 [Polycauliona sp. 1 TL-2023]